MILLIQEVEAMEIHHFLNVLFFSKLNHSNSKCYCSNPFKQFIHYNLLHCIMVTTAIHCALTVCNLNFIHYLSYQQVAVDQTHIGTIIMVSTFITAHVLKACQMPGPTAG